MAESSADEPVDPAPTRPYRVVVVCTGNICRSPMAELLLREAFDAAGLSEAVEVDSGGTTSWEVGNPADRRTLTALRRHGHPDLGGSRHRARQVDAGWLADRDLVLAADAGHLRDLQRMDRGDGRQDRIRLIRSFDPAAVAAGGLDIADPWYGDDDAFDRTYEEVQAAVPGIVSHVRVSLGR